MIRPRGGDFCYSDDEFEVMRHDITTAKSLGADGIVIGLLHPDGRIDLDRTRELVELAKPLPVTFHRAFDVAKNLPAALEDLIRIGIAHVLTSGGEPLGTQGIPSLTELVQVAAGRIKILACGGINSTNVADIIEKTGVQEVHAGLRTVISGQMQESNKNISPGVGGMNESQRFIVLEENVAKMTQAVAGIKRNS
jgi:copper homeostasis protein